MGNLSLKKDKPPQPMLLIPPMFDRQKNLRRKFCKAPSKYLFCKKDLNRLFRDYYTDFEGIRMTLDMKPEITEAVEYGDVHVIANMALPRLGEGAKGRMSFVYENRCTNPDKQPIGFLEGRVDINDLPSYRLRGAACIPNLNVGVFTNLTSKNKSKVGVRYTSETTSIGLAAVGILNNTYPVLQWWALRKYGPFTIDVEGNINKERKLEDAQINIGFTQKVGPKNSFEIAVGLDNRNNLIVSYYHHLAIRRNIFNPFSPQHIKGMTNYVNLGLQMTANQLKGSTFTSAVEWQINKNWLAKLLFSQTQIGQVIVLKTWTIPNLTVAVSNMYNFKEKALKQGIEIGLENHGDVTYHKADLISEVPTKWEP